MIRSLALKLLFVYQKFFTLLGFGSCRYYPTCSEYAKWQFQKNALYKAPFLTLIRILRCNQLFDGGIDYPVIQFRKKYTNYLSCNETKNRFIVEFWLVPKRGDYYYLIKTF